VIVDVDRAADRVSAIADKHASIDATGEALGSQAVARHIGVSYHELRQHARFQGERLARAVMLGAKVESVVRLAYMAGFYAGAMWARAEDAEKASKGERVDD
jgi:hypothetical protein